MRLASSQIAIRLTQQIGEERFAETLHASLYIVSIRCLYPHRIVERISKMHDISPPVKWLKWLGGMESLAKYRIINQFGVMRIISLIFVGPLIEQDEMDEVADPLRSGRLRC